MSLTNIFRDYVVPIFIAGAIGCSSTPMKKEVSLIHQLSPQSITRRDKLAKEKGEKILELAERIKSEGACELDPEGNKACSGMIKYKSEQLVRAVYIHTDTDPLPDLLDLHSMAKDAKGRWKHSLNLGIQLQKNERRRLVTDFRTVYRVDFHTGKLLYSKLILHTKEYGNPPNFDKLIGESNRVRCFDVTRSEFPDTDNECLPPYRKQFKRETVHKHKYGSSN